MTVTFRSSSRAFQTGPMASVSVRAPVGQTDTHWPHMAQAVELRGRPMAGEITVSKPRFWALMAPTSWTWLHTVTHRRHRMHLAVSRVMEGDTSTWAGPISPERRHSVTPNSSPRAWRFFMPSTSTTHTRQVPYWWTSFR